MLWEALPLELLERIWSSPRDRWNEYPRLHQNPLPEDTSATLELHNSLHHPPAWSLRFRPHALGFIPRSLGRLLRDHLLPGTPASAGTFDPSTSFGELRALMQQRTLSQRDLARVWRLLSSCFEHDPRLYREAWTGYVLGSPEHFIEPLAWFEDPRSCGKAAAMAPWANWGYVLRNPQDLDALIDSPWSDALTSLVVRGYAIEPSPLHAAIEGSMRGLRTLDLSGTRTSYGYIEMLLATLCLDSLSLSGTRHGRLQGLVTHGIRHLDLSRGIDTDPSTYHDLAHIERLESLSLEGCPLQGLALPDTLRALNLSYTRLPERDYLELLERHPKLESLELRGVSRSAALVEACTRLPRLRVLDLGFAPMNRSSLEALHDLRTLEVLRLPCTSLGAQEIRILAQAEMPGLRELELGGNTFADEGILALKRAWESRPLTKVGLANVGLKAPGSIWPESIEELDVSGNELGDVGIVQIAAWSARLRVLRVLGTGLGESGARMLLSKEALPHLEHIYVDDHDERLQGVLEELEPLMP